MSPPPAPTDAAVRAAVTLLSFGSFFGGVALRICDGLLPRLARDFDITAGTAGQVVISFSVAYGLSQLIFGPLGDRYGKARIMCTALFLSAITSLVCALAPGFDSLVWLRVLWGLSAAGVIPLSIAWVGDTVPYEQRQATLARLMLGTLGGMTAGQLAGGVFADTPLGWRGAFVTLSVGYTIVAALLFTRLRAIPSAPAVRPQGRFGVPAQLAAVLAIPWARMVLLTVACEGLFLFGPIAFLPTYVHDRYGVPLSVASGLISLFAVGGLLYAVVARRIVQRFGERRMVLAGGLIMGLGYVGWYVSPIAWLAAPVAFVTGFGTYLLHNTLQTHGSQMAPQTRGTAMALFAFCFFLAQAGGVWMGAWAYDHAGAAALLLLPAALLPLASWNFARGLRRRAEA
ncbi:MAG TPA: MFS transporter [Ramlibacter sp.]|jgi:predicted MFS family arabinose efflux permease|nr:MFS transporter [Ramlibacter sp.]